MRQQKHVSANAARDRAVEIRKILTDLFTLEDMKSLAFDLNINYQAIGGDTVDEFSRELLLYCEKRGLTDTLVHRGQELRPHAPWPVL